MGGGGEDARGDPARLGLRDAHRRVQGGEVHQDRDALPAGRRLGERRDLHQPRVAPRDGGDGRRAPPPAQGVLRADPRREAQVPRGGHPLLPALDPRHQVPRRGQAGRRRFAPPIRHATRNHASAPLTAPSHVQVDEAELLTALTHSITCALLAPAGPQRSRLLGMLYKDERAPKAPSYGILTKARATPSTEAARTAARRARHRRSLTPRASSLPSLRRRRCTWTAC